MALYLYSSTSRAPIFENQGPEEGVQVRLAKLTTNGLSSNAIQNVNIYS